MWSSLLYHSPQYSFVTGSLIVSGTHPLDWLAIIAGVCLSPALNTGVTDICHNA